MFWLKPLFKINIFPDLKVGAINNMIEAKNITKKFNKQIAVDDISFNVDEGENFVLLGTSGCGKTTTLKMLNRLIEPTDGEIFINQKNIKNEDAETLRRNIGYALQNTGLFPHYTVAENIAVVPNLFKFFQIFKIISHMCSRNRVKCAKRFVH